jgi:hypothetical protein
MVRSLLEVLLLEDLSDLLARRIVAKRDRKSRR